ncbi:MAG: glycosyltransferase [Lactobacillales bacterium]|nr:glycosyltransferase [Lactobacillales bacterium]
MKELSRLADSVYIVVNGDLSSADKEKLGKIGDLCIRENQGYDTGAFKYAIQKLKKEKLSRYDQLLMVNDTNVGPFGDLNEVFEFFSKKKVDFWGITQGEKQRDYLAINPYGYVPNHLQSFFIVVEKSLLMDNRFYEYFDRLPKINKRDEAILYHETVFTKYFSDLGYRYRPYIKYNTNSATYTKPLTFVKEFKSPIVKYSAFEKNKFKYEIHGLDLNSEVPTLIDYIRNKMNYPEDALEEILEDIEKKEVERQHILIIDGVENQIPQCTRYRVLNKKEQLESLGYKVRVVNNSKLQVSRIEYAKMVIVYRAPYSDLLSLIADLCHKYSIPILFDIDDLVIDTKYTDLLNYTKNLSQFDKKNYDSGVNNYKKAMLMCDGVITSTSDLARELKNYTDLVLLNRNLASNELIELSQRYIEHSNNSESIVKIGYFSGSITHNENFELIKSAIVNVLKRYENVELHLVGYLSLPDDLKIYSGRVIVHDYVCWEKLPELISGVDINLAPLVDNVFNRAKSEIKWLEAALVKIPTIASNIGAFKEMIVDGSTGVLANNDEWFEKLERLIISVDERKKLAENAYKHCIDHCCTSGHTDEIIDFVRRMIE